jgi:hypothetical protein
MEEDQMSTTSTGSDDVEQLRRQLRAMAAVNQQLHAQLEGQMVRSVGRAGAHGGDLLGDSDMFSGMVLNARRVGIASGWLQQLQVNAGGDVYLARTPSREVFLVEGTLRRAVKAGLIVSALAKAIGPVREVGQSDLNHFGVGPPVEVVEGTSGPAFVVVGGRRLPIRGLPLPYPVSNDDLSVFPMGEELNMSLGALGGGRSPVQRAKELVASEGVVQGAKRMAGKVTRRVRGTVKKAGT